MNIYNIVLKNGVELNGIENINTNLSIHFIVYKITNNINNKFYIGQHTTYNPYDLYVGSGYLLKLAEQKYNLSSFTKTILFDFDNRQDMLNKERELMPLLSCNLYNKQCYNIVQGGGGGFLDKNGINIAKGCKHSEQSKIKHQEAAKKRIHTEYEKQKQSLTMTGRKQSKETIEKRVAKNKGKKRTIEQKKRMSIAQKNKKISKNSILKQLETKRKNGTLGVGKSNPNFGKRKMISKNNKKIIINVKDVEYYINQGFKFTNPKWNKMYIII